MTQQNFVFDFQQKSIFHLAHITARVVPTTCLAQKPRMEILCERKIPVNIKIKRTQTTKRNERGKRIKSIYILYTGLHCPLPPSKSSIRLGPVACRFRSHTPRKSFSLSHNTYTKSNRVDLPPANPFPRTWTSKQFYSSIAEV